MYDVLIIGGGVTGAAIARELSRYRLKIALLEKETELAFGVSKSNSGIIHPGTQNPPDSLKGKFCVLGNLLTREIAKELGVDFKEVGELIVIFNEADRPRLQQIKAEGERLGVPRLRIVERAWLREHEPNLNPDALAALYAPTAGIISPYRWVYALAENAARNGVKIFLGHKVTGITPEPGNRRLNVSVSRTEEPRRSVSGSEVTFRARFVINCAGLYADEVARLAGIDDLTIKPRKGEEFLLDKKREHLVNHIIFPLPTPTTKGILVIKTSDGNPMIGPTAEEVADKEDRSTSDAGLQKVLAATRQLVPSLSENDIIAYFAGLRPVAGKDFIIRHEAKVPGLITVAGIQSPGLTAGPAIALLVVELLKKHGLWPHRKLSFQHYRPKTTHLFSLPVTHLPFLLEQDPTYGEIVCRCEMVSAREVRDAIKRGARTLDGIKFRTRAQAGRCHGGFCTTRIMKIMIEELKLKPTEITKRGPGSNVIVESRE
ncbi:MAG: NAD(P)/FAD-dependent oxidoreductase [Candidatus Margulisbacteria bacterium]|jgi:glycerol-3-phosphate dehydrogenase|nr:NAD(P)/FAD-dependent oxidoreductase [Candidatus Margulisiibacteriota bacterium]